MTETLANRYTSERIQWEASDGYRKPSHPSALDESSLSIGRVEILSSSDTTISEFVDVSIDR